MTDFDNYKDFGRRVATFKHTINIWPQYKRVLQLYKGGNREYLIQEIKKIFPEDFIMCRNELENYTCSSYDRSSWIPFTT